MPQTLRITHQALWTVLGLYLTACSQEVEFASSTRTVTSENAAPAVAAIHDEAPKEISCSLRISPEAPATQAKVYVSATPVGLAPSKGTLTVNAGSEIAMACASNLCLGSYESSGQAEVIEVKLSTVNDAAVVCSLAVGKNAAKPGDSIAAQADTAGSPNYQTDTSAPTNPAPAPSPTVIGDTTGAQYIQSIPDTASAPPPAPEFIEKTFSFNLTENVVSSAPKEIEVVFVIDDSASMTNKIKRLTSALGSLASQLVSTNTTKVNLSYILLSEYYNAKAGGWTFSMKNRMVNCNPHVYSDSLMAAFSMIDGKFASSHPVCSTFGVEHLTPAVDAGKVQTMVAALNQLKVSQTLELNGGIGAIMDYLSFRKYSPQTQSKLKPGSPFHYILISDGDNTRLRSIIGSNRNEFEYEAQLTHLTYVQWDQQDTNPCAAPSLTTAQYPNAYLELENDGVYCVDKNSGVALDEAKKKLDGWFSEKASVYTGKLADGTPSYSMYSTSARADVKYCSYYASYTCQRTVDGVPQTFNNVDYVWTFKNGASANPGYDSCVPVISSIRRDSNYNPAFQDMVFSKPIECVAMVEKPFARRPPVRLTTANQGQSYSSIVQDACSANEDRVITASKAVFVSGELIIGRAKPDPSKLSDDSFCPKQVENATLGSNLSFQVRQMSKRTRVSPFLGYSDADVLSLENVMAGIKKTDIWASSRTLSNFKLLTDPAPTRYFRDYPASAVDFFSTVHADNRVYVHSIVKKSAGSCPQDGNDSPNAKPGTEFMKLSSLTGGLTLDICSSSFDPLVGQIFDFIRQTTVWNYDIKNIVDSDTLALIDYLSLTKVVNKTANKTLAASTYTLRGDQLGLQAGVAVVGDKIEFTVRMPKLATKPAVSANQIPDQTYSVNRSDANALLIQTSVAADAGLTVLVGYNRAPGLAPMDCSQAQVVVLPGDSGAFMVNGLLAATQYSLRICVKDRNGNTSRGRVLTAATLGATTVTTTPYGSDSSAGNSAGELLDSCSENLSTWTNQLKVSAGEQESSVTKLCRCSGFVNGMPYGPDASGKGYYGFSGVCTAATQQGIIGENDDNMPIRLTIYKRSSGNYGPFTGKTMNGVRSQSGNSASSYPTMYKVEKP